MPKDNPTPEAGQAPEEQASKPASSRPTKTDIAAWKKEHGEVYQIEVDDKILILRRPGIQDLERAMAADPKRKKPFNFNRSIHNNCKLYEDPGFSSDDQVLLAAYAQFDEIIEMREAQLKKL